MFLLRKTTSKNDSKFRTQADYDLSYKMFVAIFLKEKNSGALLEDQISTVN